MGVDLCETCEMGTLLPAAGSDVGGWQGKFVGKQKSLEGMIEWRERERESPLLHRTVSCCVAPFQMSCFSCLLC